MVSIVELIKKEGKLYGGVEETNQKTLQKKSNKKENFYKKILPIALTLSLLLTTTCSSLNSKKEKNQEKENEYHNFFDYQKENNLTPQPTSSAIPTATPQSLESKITSEPTAEPTAQPIPKITTIPKHPKKKIENQIKECVPDYSNQVYTSNLEEKVYSAMSLNKNAIIRYSNMLEINAKTIASIYYTETIQHILNDGLKEGKANFMEACAEGNDLTRIFGKGIAKSLGLTYGELFMDFDAAKETQRRLNEIMGKEIITKDVLNTYLENPSYAILLATGMLKTLQEEWKNDPNGTDISDKPDILATLYNNGYKWSHPKKNPQPGGSEDQAIIIDGKYISKETRMPFGLKVLNVYNSKSMQEFFAE
jgi:hypothetical protein